MTAIETMKYLLDKAEYKTPEGHQLVSVNIPVDIIREIVSTAQQWIPCSERLPEDEKDVFVYLFDRPSPYIAWVRGRHWYTEDFEVGKEDEPLAWMPLPEPWKGEET